MKISQDYLNRCTSKKVLFTASSGQFICDGKVVDRIQQEAINNYSLNDVPSPSCINSLKVEPKLSKTCESKQQVPSKTSIVPNSPVSSIQKQPRIPEIVMFSKSSSHYPVEPPQYLYLNDRTVNDANKKRADEINLHRRVYVEDSNQSIPKSEYINRIWFPATKRMRSLEKIVR